MFGVCAFLFAGDEICFPWRFVCHGEDEHENTKENSDSKLLKVA